MIPDLIESVISKVEQSSLFHIQEAILQLLKQLSNQFSEFQGLSEKVSIYDKVYYVDSDPIVTDHEYDVVKSQLYKFIGGLKTTISAIDEVVKGDKKLHFIIQLTKKVSSVVKRKESKVGAKPSRSFKKVKHGKPMLSLSNCFTKEDVLQFINRVGCEEIVCELKIDGVSFSIVYEDGKLIRGLTRGDGKIGEDITLNIKQISGIPHEIPYKGRLEARGEIYLDKETFEAIKDENNLSNPRNAASGAIRQLDPKVTRSRNLKYFIWNLDIPGVETHYDQLQFAKTLGFHINEKIAVAKSVDEMLEFYDQAQNTRNTLDYEIDGVVYKINSLTGQEKLGNNSNAPRWATAHKFPAVDSYSEIVDIITQVGRSGVLTPVAVLKPVNIGGATVTRATLHNYRELQRNDYRIGDTVSIIRSGDVIPKITGIVKRGETTTQFKMPDRCTVCNSEIIDDENGVYKLCTGGWACKAQKIERLVHFASRGAFNIVGLSDKQIEYFVNENLINSYADIFKLHSINERLTIPLQERAGWGDRSVSVLFDSIDKARSIEFRKFIYSLAIPLVGAEVSNLLATRFTDYDTLISAVKLNRSLIGEINGVGEQIVKSLMDFFSDAKNLQLVDDLLQEIQIIPCEKDEGPKEVFAFTGSLESFTRDEAVELLARNNKAFSSSVTQKVNYLVVGSDPSNSKLEKAKKLNIKILTEDEFKSTVIRTVL